MQIARVGMRGVDTTITTAGRTSSSSAFLYLGQPWWPTQTPVTSNMRRMNSLVYTIDDESSLLLQNTHVYNCFSADNLSEFKYIRTERF